MPVKWGYMKDYRIVFCTVPSKKTAAKITKAVLEARLAACVNVIPSVDSAYWWKGKIERSRELLLIMKTQSTKMKKLIQCIKSNHPYEVPEIISMKIQEGSEDYLAWIKQSVKTAG
jgi:periplasmic divalent cation tolerance protein